MLRGQGIVRGVVILSFFFVYSSFLLPVRGEKPYQDEDVTSPLERFLTRAERDGILSKAQAEKLLQRATKEELLEKLRLQVTKDAQPAVDRPTGPEKKSLFMRMYNRFSLLTVIYFSGSLLIMGAYTLLMTLAWDRFGGWQIVGIMSSQLLASGAAGTALWFTEDWQFVGGLLVTISTSMVPFTVYGIERALDWWPRADPGMFQGFSLYIRPGWVAMEIATVVVGLGYLLFVRFPFLLSPVSFSLWFLSMDLTPLLPTWGYSLFRLRVMVSLVFGLSLLGAGRLMELVLGSDPDFGFWLYLFGLIAFWFSLTFDFPERKTKVSLYLLINVCLILIGSHLDRYTFKVFGSMGIFALVYGNLSPRFRVKKSNLLWVLKSLAVASLFAQAMKHEGNVELANGLICFFIFNLESLLFVTSGEQYCWFLLLTNLGFAVCAHSFDRPLDLWLFSVNAKTVVSFSCSLPVSLFHINLLKYLMRDGGRDWTIDTHFYLLYRLLVSACIGFAFVIVDLQRFAWVGGIGIPLVAVIITNRWNSLFGGHYRVWDFAFWPALEILESFCAMVFGILLSLYFQSIILYLVCCAALIHLLITTFSISWRPFGCLLSVILILLSVPVQSKFLIAIAAIYIFIYLSDLAYRVFKNSFLFPLALVVLGLVLIAGGTVYQAQEEALHTAFMSLLPAAASEKFTSISNLGFTSLYPMYKEASFSYQFLLWRSYLWLLWPAALTHSLAKNPVPYVSYICGGGIVVLMGLLLYYKFLKKLEKDLSNVVKVDSFDVRLLEGHGMLARITGTKPHGLTLNFAYVALNVEGESFWAAVSRRFGNFRVNFVRTAILPYNLTPPLIKLENFTAGSNRFSATIRLGTGEHRSLKLSRTAIVSNAATLSYIDEHIEFNLLYRTAWYRPYSKLCAYTKAFDDLCTDLYRQGQVE